MAWGLLQPQRVAQACAPGSRAHPLHWLPPPVMGQVRGKQEKARATVSPEATVRCLRRKAELLDLEQKVESFRRWQGVFCETQDEFSLPRTYAKTTEPVLCDRHPTPPPRPVLADRRVGGMFPLSSHALPQGQDRRQSPFNSTSGHYLCPRGRAGHEALAGGGAAGPSPTGP